MDHASQQVPQGEEHACKIRQDSFGDSIMARVFDGRSSLADAIRERLSLPTGIGMLTMLNLARFGVGARVSGAGGNAPPRSRRTGREPLSSYGSRCKATLRPKLPVSKESRIAPRYTQEPLLGSPKMVSSLLVFPCRPSGKDAVEVPPERISDSRYPSHWKRVRWLFVVTYIFE